jgi:XRE family transcriptional regulator, regulator of sulfur utilization
MNISRREMTLLLPALAASRAAGQQGQVRPLPSRVYHDKQLSYEGNQQKKGRRFFFGPSHSGFNLEMHETILGVGTETHPPHQHVHEEVLVVVEGTAEVLCDGKTEQAEAGSVVYFASNQMHGARNAGRVPCRYYVMELRGDNAG